MTSRHQPAHGADSPAGLTLRRYRVQLVEEEGPAWYVTVYALGPKDARAKARAATVRKDDYASVIDVQEVPDDLLPG